MTTRRSSTLTCRRGTCFYVSTKVDAHMVKGLPWCCHPDNSLKIMFLRGDIKKISLGARMIGGGVPLIWYQPCDQAWHPLCQQSLPASPAGRKAASPASRCGPWIRQLRCAHIFVCFGEAAVGYTTGQLLHQMRKNNWSLFLMFSRHKLKQTQTWQLRICHRDYWNHFIFNSLSLLMESSSKVRFVNLVTFPFFFWLHHTACGILVPWPGIEPRPMAVKALGPNHWTARKFPSHISDSTNQLYFTNEVIILKSVSPPQAEL